MNGNCVRLVAIVHSLDDDRIPIIDHGAQVGPAVNLALTDRSGPVADLMAPNLIPLVSGRTACLGIQIVQAGQISSFFQNVLKRSALGIVAQEFAHSGLRGIAIVVDVHVDRSGCLRRLFDRHSLASGHRIRQVCSGDSRAVFDLAICNIVCSHSITVLDFNYLLRFKFRNLIAAILCSTRLTVDCNGLGGITPLHVRKIQVRQGHVAGVGDLHRIGDGIVELCLILIRCLHNGDIGVGVLYLHTGYRIRGMGSAVTGGSSGGVGDGLASVRFLYQILRDKGLRISLVQVEGASPRRRILYAIIHRVQRRTTCCGRSTRQVICQSDAGQVCLTRIGDSDVPRDGVADLHLSGSTLRQRLCHDQAGNRILRPLGVQSRILCDVKCVASSVGRPLAISLRIPTGEAVVGLYQATRIPANCDFCIIGIFFAVNRCGTGGSSVSVISHLILGTGILVHQRVGTSGHRCAGSGSIPPVIGAAAVCVGHVALRNGLRRLRPGKLVVLINNHLVTSRAGILLAVQQYLGGQLADLKRVRGDGEI